MRVAVDYRDTGELKSAGCSEQLFLARIKFDVLGTDLRKIILLFLIMTFFFNGERIRMRFRTKPYHLY